MPKRNGLRFGMDFPGRIWYNTQHENRQLSALAEILALRSGEQLVYTNLGRDLAIDEKTAKSWVKILKHLYFGFEVRPWFRNVENSIRKTPKWYMRDWATIKDGRDEGNGDIVDISDFLTEPSKDCGATMKF